MDWKAFLSSIVGSLAWPAVILVLFFLLRRNLPDLAERIEEITLPGGYKARFVRALEKGRIEAELAVTQAPNTSEPNLKPDDHRLELASRFPEASVLETYKEVEAILLELRTRLDMPQRTNLRTVVRRLVERELAPKEAQALFENFQQARNAAAHAGNENRITPGEAIEYMEQGASLAGLFRNALKALSMLAPNAKL
jgi:hypothetical protein